MAQYIAVFPTHEKAFLNEIINEEGEVLALELDVNAAKELTESIKSTATATCLLLQQAHDELSHCSTGEHYTPQVAWVEEVPTQHARIHTRDQYLQ